MGRSKVTSSAIGRVQVGEHGAGNLELSVPISNFGVHDAGTRSAISFCHAPFPRSATSAVPVDTLHDHLSDSGECNERLTLSLSIKPSSPAWLRRLIVVLPCMTTKTTSDHPSSAPLRHCSSFTPQQVGICIPLAAVPELLSWSTPQAQTEISILVVLVTLVSAHLGARFIRAA